MDTEGCNTSVINFKNSGKHTSLGRMTVKMYTRSMVELIKIEYMRFHPVVFGGYRFSSEYSFT